MTTKTKGGVIFYHNLGEALNEFDRFDQSIPLSEIVADNSEYFIKMGIEPNWVLRFSWTDLYNFGLNPLAVNWHTVVRKKLIKGIKGVHFQFAQSLDYFEGTKPLWQLGEYLVERGVHAIFVSRTVGTFYLMYPELG